jgi:tetratricopeptide (TPR) repeat protein
MQRPQLKVGLFLLLAMILILFGHLPISAFARNLLSLRISHTFVQTGNIASLPPNSSNRICPAARMLHQEMLLTLSERIQAVHPQGLISFLAVCGDSESMTNVVTILKDSTDHGYILQPMERYFLGEMLLALNRRDEVIKYWKDSSAMASLMASRGQVALHVNNNVQKALMYFSLSEAILSIPTPDRVMMYMGLCQIFLSQQKWNEAENACRLFQSLSSTATQRVIAHNLLGRIFFDSGDYGKAQDEFEAAVNIQPNDSENHYWLGLALESRGLKEEAIIQYQKVLEIDSTHMGTRNALERLLK